MVVPTLETTVDSAQRSHLTEVDWLATSPIGSYAGAFKRHVTKLRYAAHTIASYLAEITHFGRSATVLSGTPASRRRMPAVWRRSCT